MNEVNEKIAPEYWAAVATGEGAEALIISNATLPDGLHRLLCVCRKPWNECETEDVRAILGERLDNPDYQTFDEAGRVFSVEVMEHELGKVVLYAIYTKFASIPLEARENE